MDNIISVQKLGHHYGKHLIYEDLSFAVPEGRVVGLLGKNGVGKTTLIKILMGFLRPSAGVCKVFGEASHRLSPKTRSRIGLLFEGHLTYDKFMNIEQLERFYAPFYPKWNRKYYYELVDLLGLPYTRKAAAMSCGQRSQVVLGLIMAQQPDLLILDDYSMGLDAGYRRLFLDYMQEYLMNGSKTVFLTSHVIQDMERLVDEVIFLERGGRLMTTSLKAFMNDFRCFLLPRKSAEGQSVSPKAAGCIKNIELHPDYYEIFSFSPPNMVEKQLSEQGVNPAGLKQKAISLEDAFIGYTGRYL
ncbi:MAG: methyltransferase [Deltaproteobacteria bacterium]|nr:MAG: methyltransferase [Deltaproteobacteria bacterium]